MADLADILKNRRYSEPSEFLAIKQYVAKNFGVEVNLSTQADMIIISARSAALANTLRLHSRQIQQACGLTKRLVFRIR